MLWSFIVMNAFLLKWNYIVAGCNSWHVIIDYESWLTVAHVCIQSIPCLVNNPSITNHVLWYLDFTVVDRNHTAFAFLRTDDSILKIVPVYPPVFCWAVSYCDSLCQLTVFALPVSPSITLRKEWTDELVLKRERWTQNKDLRGVIFKDRGM